MNEIITPNVRSVAIVGPYLSGKTTLLESLLFVTGAINRKGSIKDHNTVGDSAPEARERDMSVEVTVASTETEGVHFTFLDCPGSVEFAQESYNTLVGVDAAIVVCEPEPERVLTLTPLLKFLDDWQIPHVLFINKVDRAKTPFRETLQALKAVSSRPLVLQQIPIGIGSQLVGFVDLVAEQAYHYHPGAAADPIPLSEDLREQEQAAHAEMLEALADFDDHLLEELVEEIEPPQAEVIEDLTQDLRQDLIMPVFWGVADHDYGVRPLLKALIEECPTPAQTLKRRSISTDEPVAQVLKTYYTQHGGKFSLVRIWQGTILDNMSLNGNRIGGIYQLQGQQQAGVPSATMGEIVALARMEGIKTGETLTLSQAVALPRVELPLPVYALAIVPEKQSDQVKLSGALAKLMEEDPSIFWEQHGDTHEALLWGQGEIHLQVSLDRLARKYRLPMTTHMPRIPYKETIRRSTSVHGRYKHQTGGHGQFGDVYLDIQPLPRGEGFQFEETVVGGVVPRHYIPSVELGVREYMEQGPLGFPLVDISVTLTNGSYHSVDSSEQAFKQAARIAMQKGTAECDSVLLEPIIELAVSVPTIYTSQALQLLTGRRGQILGYELKREWPDWDQISAYLPQSEMRDFIIELRSLTFGIGFFEWKFHHLQDMPQKLADQVLVTSGSQGSQGSQGSSNGKNGKNGKGHGNGHG